MDICVIGAGYVGLTSAAVLAYLGHHVTCVDKNQQKIEQLNNGQMPLYEPGLQDFINQNKANLAFSADVQEAIRKNPILLIAVGTPSLPDGNADLTYVHKVVEDISDCISSYKTIIIKSTVPPGTSEEMIEELCRLGTPRSLFAVASNPEFLREGTALQDMLYPDKTVIGVTKGDRATAAIVQGLYQGISAPFVVTSLTGAEIIKYANNSFLATKISFINEVARICDVHGVEITDVARGIGLDNRIGPAFLQAGIGYGGSCFPKDVNAFIHTADQGNVAVPLLRAAQLVNETQVQLYIDKLLAICPSPAIVAVLGIAFKPHTDDTRFSPAVAVIRKLIDAGCHVRAYDPVAKLTVGGAVQAASVEAAVQDADCLFLATEWPEFRQLDWPQLKQLMRKKIFFDGRNYIDRADVERHGFTYIGVGRP